MDKKDAEKLFDEGIDKINKLPKEVKKSMAEIRDYDVQCNAMMKNITMNVVGYAKSMKKMTTEQKRHQIAEIEKMYLQAEKLTRSKVTIATDLYDKIDDDISVIDKNMKKIEARSRRGWNSDNDDPTTSNGRRKKKKSRKGEDSPHPNTNPEMPVDPHEPVYCNCHQVSFGEMVCCDNQDCKTEWFHFQCVGLVHGIPKSVKWFCETCRPSFKQVPNQWNYVTNEPPRKSKKAKMEEKGILSP